MTILGKTIYPELARPFQMLPCKHESLEFVGEQRTDEGVNSYYKCKNCGTMLVMTPSRQVYGIPGLQQDKPASGK
jgi:hypothetical protein